jgi:hypothetical protein
MVGWRRAPPPETTSKIKGRDRGRESGQSASLIAPLARCAQRPHCLAGHVGLELRNVVANYPFESSHRFAGIQPKPGDRDYSRSSCDGGRRSSGLVPGSGNVGTTRILAEGDRTAWRGM